MPVWKGGHCPRTLARGVAGQGNPRFLVRGASNPSRQRPGTWHTIIRRKFGWALAAASLVCIAPAIIGMADASSPPESSLDSDALNFVEPTIQRFKLPTHIPASDLKRDTSAVGRYAAMQAADTARSDFQDYFGSRHLTPGEFSWRTEPTDRASIHLVVIISEQRAFVYEGPILVAATTVSTGRAGHSTPTGVFPITEKHELKLSNLYDNAPMPYMQRLTNDGIALHAGHIPGIPASHGCVRLPLAFAKKLFSLTREGTPVLIAG